MAYISEAPNRTPDGLSTPSLRLRISQWEQKRPDNTVCNYLRPSMMRPPVWGLLFTKSPCVQTPSWPSKYSALYRDPSTSFQNLTAALGKACLMTNSPDSPGLQLFPFSSKISASIPRAFVVISPAKCGWVKRPCRTTKGQYLPVMCRLHVKLL